MVAALCTSCSNEYEEPQGEKVLSVTFGGDYSFEPFTRAGVTTANAQDVWIFDYMDGRLVQSMHQKAGDENFGKPEIALKYGTHDLYFLVANGQSPISNANAICWSVVGDTYWKHTIANITALTGDNLAVMLSRVATMLKLRPSDQAPDNVKSLKIVPSLWSYGINYLTGKPSGLWANRHVICQGTGDIDLYGIGDYGETFVNFDIYALSEDGETVKFCEKKNIPFTHNRITTMTGSIYSEGGAHNCALQISASWEQEYCAEW